MKQNGNGSKCACLKEELFSFQKMKTDWKMNDTF